MKTSVFLYVPNLIGYLRLLLLFISNFYFDSKPSVFVVLYSINAMLDGVDGAVARVLNQTSSFGAWFDVVIDNVVRGMLWSSFLQWGWLFPSLEWCVLTCTHSQHGADWKNAFQNSPWLIKKLMAKNFKTPIGVFAMLGLHVLPIWLYAHYTKVLTVSLHLSPWLQYTVIALLSIGRAMCLFAEVWCIWIHIKHLVDEKGAQDNVITKESK
ncbi:bifunctional IPC transferase and DIPP synthase-like [Saccoglossus kowalevskii]